MTASEGGFTKWGPYAAPPMMVPEGESPMGGSSGVQLGGATRGTSNLGPPGGVPQCVSYMWGLQVGP